MDEGKANPAPTQVLQLIHQLFLAERQTNAPAKNADKTGEHCSCVSTAETAATEV